jgi:nucleotide-binding universal stress UspA family protein
MHMIGFTKVLIPLDGSPEGEAILPLARALAESEGAQVVLLRVVGPVDAELSPAPALVGLLSIEAERDALQAAQAMRDRTLDEARQHAEGYLQRMSSQYFAPGAPVTLEVGGGLAADAILTVAAATRADVIALSLIWRDDAHQRSTSRVADEVIHRAEVPVVLVRPG